MNRLYYYRSPQKGTRGPIAFLLFVSFLMLLFEPSFILAQIVFDKPSQSTATDSIGIEYNDGDSRPQGFLRKGSESAAAAAAAGTNAGKMDDENVLTEQQHGQERIDKDPVTTNVKNQVEPGENSQGNQDLQAKTQRGLKHYKGYGYYGYSYKAYKGYKGYGYKAYPKAYNGYGYYGGYYGSSYYGRSYYGRSYYGSYHSPYSYVSSNYRVPYSYSYRSYVFSNYRAPQGYSPYGYGYRERD